MDDNGHRENGRHKQQPPGQPQGQPQGQWLMQHHPSMKQIMGIMAERDAALQERSLALSEKKAALAERDMAILQRDSAIAERDNAIMERDNAICTLGGVKHIHHHSQHQQQVHLSEAPYESGDMRINHGSLPMSPVASQAAKPRQTKRPKEAKAMPAAAAAKKAAASKSSKKVKRESEELSKMIYGRDLGGGGSEDLKKQQRVLKSDWKDQDLGLNQVCFDETTMPVPVCSCTGVLRPCYKWGNGGWQSSCCTTTVSMYPLPAVPNKRHARVGGRKMSGSAFNKLISRLAAEGHDLSSPVDLRDNWAKHGTNRYITIK